MPDYKKMYFELFNCISDAIALLQHGQQNTEESYIENLPVPLSQTQADTPEDSQ